MSGIRWIISVAALQIAAAGCSPLPNYVGTWTGSRHLKAVDGADPVIVGTLEKVQLIVHSNGRFDFFDMGLPYSGTWLGTSTGCQLRFDSSLGVRDKASNAARVEIIKLMPGPRLLYHNNDQDVILSRQVQPRE